MYHEIALTTSQASDGKHVHTYKKNFIRTRASTLTKVQEQAKTILRFAFMRVLLYSSFIVCIFIASATAICIIFCSIFLPVFIMTVISYICCIFGIVARKSSPCFKAWSPYGWKDRNHVLATSMCLSEIAYYSFPGIDCKTRL